MTPTHKTETNDRDRVAEARDRMADERDRVADARDRAAAQRDRAGRRFSSGDPGRCAEDRERAAGDRAEAARDRAGAAGDRERAAGERAQAGIDGLTGALRRERGMVDLAREIDRARRSEGCLVLAFVDVDGLKATNDAEGHAAGDELLRDVAGALRGALRSYDLIVRFGGDEFLCALPGANLESAGQRFDDVTRELAERNARASVSTGLAELEDADTLDRLTARADAALYAGRRRFDRGHATAGLSG